MLLSQRLRIPRLTIHYEACEERLALAAQPWSALAIEPLAAADPQAQYGPLSAPAEPLQDLTADLAYVREKYGLSGAGQTVAVIDSGIAYDHLALGAGLGPGQRVAGGWDFAENDADPYDDGPAGFHGTMVAGVLGSSDATHPGAATGVDFVALRVFNDQGSGNFTWVEQALGWVHEHRNSFRYPITTVNLSLGANLEPGQAAAQQALERELAQLKADGMFVAVAAGNSFEDAQVHGLSYPAASSSVMPVASLQDNGQFSLFSQRDTRVLAAPGEHVTSTVPSFVLGGGGLPNDFAYAHGTSLATPYVAGASVLVREAMQAAGYHEINQDTLNAHLRQTADSFYDPDTQQTYLKLDVGRAIDSLLANATPDTSHGTVAVSDGVSRSGLAVEVQAIAADDSIEVRAGSTLHIVVNGVDHAFPAAEIQRVSVHGVAGQNSLTLTGDDSDTVVKLQPGTVEWSTPQLLVTAENLATITVINGSGFGEAYLADSAGDDTLTAQPAKVVLQGPSFTLQVQRFTRVYAAAEAGGDDTAELHDSSGNDRFYAAPRSASLSGQGYYQQVTGFGHIYATAGAGGVDEATFTDSSGNDRFYARPESATMSGWGYYNQAANFRRVVATAAIGADDRAELYDTSGDDHFSAYPTFATLASERRSVEVHGFGRVYACSQAGGQDSAAFNDSTFADRFDADPTFASMSGLGYCNSAAGFHEVTAYSTGGQATANLTGSFGNDTLRAGAAQVHLGNSQFSLTTVDFTTVNASGGGGADVAIFEELGQGDAFHGKQALAALTDGVGLKNLRDFDEVTLQGYPLGADIEALDYVFRQIS